MKNFKFRGACAATKQSAFKLALSAMFLIIATGIFTMCEPDEAADSEFLPPPARIDTPTATPPAGGVASGTEITLSTTTEDADIFYTTSDGTPDIPYSENTTLTITEATTLKAIAKKQGMTDSEVLTAEYTIGASVDPEGPVGGTPTSSPNLMITFQVPGTDAAAVSETFNRVSAFVQTAQTRAAISEKIHLGDYIDLPSLTVTGYDGTTKTTNNENAEYGYINITSNEPITPTGSLPFDGYEGAKLRIIVVGINSFQSTGTYTAPTENNVPHVVFQFQNLTGQQKMNTDSTNAGGYTTSLMRKYLAPIDGAASGSFYNGLLAAGVPANVLWAPKRSMAIDCYDPAGASCNTIQDVLWLPTAWEVFGSQSYSALSETAENQAHLEYYDSDAKRKKHNNMSGAVALWWDASPSYAGAAVFFCYTTHYGTSNNGIATASCRIAPAFCVK
jgi:hypothetical protein